MPNQNECDHVVLQNGTFLVCKSELQDHIEMQILVRFNARGRVRQLSPKQLMDERLSPFHFFNFCPECGAKIDWEAIKEACDEH